MTTEQQSALMMHRARELLVRQRTMLVIALRGNMAEFGLVGAQGLHNLATLTAIIRDNTDRSVPDIARQILTLLFSHIDEVEKNIATLEAKNGLAQK